MKEAIPTTKKPKVVRRLLLFILLGPLALCVVLAALSAMSNLTLPAPPADQTALTSIDRARIAEALHLKQSLGDAVWQGWGSQNIPLVIWNDEYAFLIGFENPPPGWEPVAETRIGDQRVYRRAAGDQEAFTAEIVDGTWAGTMSVKWLMDAGLRDQFNEMLPTPLDVVFPYRLLNLSTEVYIGGLLHEIFHAFQATAVRSRFDDAETAYLSGNQYQAAYNSMQEAWQAEVNLLIQAMEAKTDEEVIATTREFLAQRDQRRAAAKLGPELILYERRFEWLEGLAKYAETGIWEVASQTTSYAPLREMADDTDFQAYKTFDQRWFSEVIAMRNAANNVGDSLFYYTGMAQSRLLDRVMPDWKSRIFDEGVWLEDLLAEAVAD